MDDAFLKCVRLPRCIPAPELASAPTTSYAAEHAPWRMFVKNIGLPSCNPSPELESAPRKSYAVEYARRALFFKRQPAAELHPVSRVGIRFEHQQRS